MMKQVSEALEALENKIHRQIDENSQFEMDLIDDKAEELYKWNKDKTYWQTLWLSSNRADTLIGKMKVYQYEYNMQMYKLQLEAQKSVPS